jgi:REP element-mobilizing transposase RayT
MGLPLAYFITFHTYGTWLPGHPRGSVDADHNHFGSPLAGASTNRHEASRRHLEQPPVELDDLERTIVLGAIEEVCGHREWLLHAVHVRTNHVHVVVGAERTPERVMNDLKAWATRRVLEVGLRPKGLRLWVRHGSTRYLYNSAHVDAACRYTVEDQGPDLRWARRSGSRPNSLEPAC